MVMVTRSAYRKSSGSSSDTSNMSAQNNIHPPWCSLSKVDVTKKPRKVTPQSWEMRSLYPLRENIWEYLNEDKRNLHKRKNGKACCKQTPPKNKGWGKTVISLVFLSITLSVILYLEISRSIPETNLVSINPKAKLISLLGFDSTAVDEECCYRIKHLAAALYRAEELLRSTLRSRRTMLLATQTIKTGIDKLTGVRYIEGAKATRGIGTKEWGSRVALWGIVHLWRATPSPDTVLALRRPSPSDCWPFSGSNGELILDLQGQAKVVSVSVEHIQPDSAKSAPKHFMVYGVLSNGTVIKAFDGEYRHNGPAKQYFTLLCRNVPLQRVIFTVLTNHGNLQYTCLYRIHLYEAVL